MRCKKQKIKFTRTPLLLLFGVIVSCGLSNNVSANCKASIQISGSQEGEKFCDVFYTVSPSLYGYAESCFDSALKIANDTNQARDHWLHHMASAGDYTADLHINDLELTVLDNQYGGRDLNSICRSGDASAVAAYLIDSIRNCFYAQGVNPSIFTTSSMSCSGTVTAKTMDIVEETDEVSNKKCSAFNESGVWEPWRIDPNTGDCKVEAPRTDETETAPPAPEKSKADKKETKSSDDDKNIVVCRPGSRDKKCQSDDEKGPDSKKKSEENLKAKAKKKKTKKAGGSLSD